MPLYSYLTPLLAFATLLPATAGATIIYEEDFESQGETAFFDPAGVTAGYADGWTAPNWAAGSPTQWGSSTSYGSGSIAIERTIYQGEWWYGGGIFGPHTSVTLPSSNLGDYTISLDLKGLSVDDNGPLTPGDVTIAFLSLDDSSTVLGGVSQTVDLSTDWETFSFNFLDMVQGPEGAPGDTFNPTGTKVQFILWKRSWVETTWAVDPATGPINSVFVDNISVEVVPEPSTYAALLGLAALAWAVIRRRK